MPKAPVKKTVNNLKGAGPGRPKGVPNKTTTMLKDALIQAAEAVGSDAKGKDGLVGYLTRQAKDEPVAFMTMLGKVLPLQVTGEGGAPISIIIAGADTKLL